MYLNYLGKYVFRNVLYALISALITDVYCIDKRTLLDDPYVYLYFFFLALRLIPSKIARGNVEPNILTLQTFLPPLALRACSRRITKFDLYEF